MAKVKDKFSQIGYLAVTESAANTLTFSGLSVFSNVLSSMAMVIHRVEYTVSAAVLALLAANADIMIFGISGADSMSAISLDDPEVYDYNFIEVLDYGTAGNNLQYNLPWIKDFSNLPGAGLLVPADRVFGYFQGVNLGGAGGMTARFWFSLMDLTPADYLELAQAMRVLK